MRYSALRMWYLIDVSRQKIQLTVTVRNWSGQDFHIVGFVLVDFILKFLNLCAEFSDDPLVLTDVRVNVDEV